MLFRVSLFLIRKSSTWITTLFRPWLNDSLKIDPDDPDDLPRKFCRGCQHQMISIIANAAPWPAAAPKGRGAFGNAR